MFQSLGFLRQHQNQSESSYYCPSNIYRNKSEIMTRSPLPSDHHSEPLPSTSTAGQPQAPPTESQREHTSIEIRPSQPPTPSTVAAPCSLPPMLIHHQWHPTANQRSYPSTAANQPNLADGPSMAISQLPVDSKMEPHKLQGLLPGRGCNSALT